MINPTKMLPAIESVVFKPNVVIIVLALLIVNIPFIVTQNGDKIVLNKKSQDPAVPSKTYEEFYIEHAISKKEAKKNFQENYKTLMQGTIFNRHCSFPLFSTKFSLCFSL